jgi:hypothetical protein
MDTMQPCPFCGHYAELNYDRTTAKYRVTCANAKCRNRTGTYQERYEALKRWNARAETPAERKLMQEIRDLRAQIADLREV